MRQRILPSIVLLLLCTTTVALVYHRTRTSSSPVEQKVDVVTPSPTATADIRPQIRTIVEQFYNEYEECMKRPPEAAQGRVSEYCQQNNSYISAQFYGNLVAGGIAKAGADPISCSQNPPQTISVTNVHQENDQAAATVRSQYGSIEGNEITIKLQREDSRWKVTNILCPPPH